MTAADDFSGADNDASERPAVTGCHAGVGEFDGFPHEKLCAHGAMKAKTGPEASPMQWLLVACHPSTLGGGLERTSIESVKFNLELTVGAHLASLQVTL